MYLLTCLGEPCRTCGCVCVKMFGLGNARREELRVLIEVGGSVSRVFVSSCSLCVRVRASCGVYTARRAFAQFNVASLDVGTFNLRAVDVSLLLFSVCPLISASLGST